MIRLACEDLSLIANLIDYNIYGNSKNTDRGIAYHRAKGF